MYPTALFFPERERVMRTKEKIFFALKYARNLMIVRAKVNLNLFIVWLVIQVGGIVVHKRTLPVRVSHSRHRGKLAH
jgi:hypothetical protein